MTSDELTSSSDECWPTLSDRPFRVAQAHRPAIKIECLGSGRELQMWFGFLRAGSLLAKTASTTKNWPACLTFPALFSYRHGLELAMKAIVRQYGQYAQVAPLRPTHNLMTIWTRCRAVLKELDCDGHALDAVEQIVRDFHEIDLDGQIFRYPFAPSGKEQSCRLREFDVDNLVEVMERVETFFDIVDGWLETRGYITELLLCEVKCPCCDRRSVEHVPGAFEFPPAMVLDAHASKGQTSSAP